jgi:hypothetical protein
MLPEMNMALTTNHGQIAKFSLLSVPPLLPLQEISKFGTESSSLLSWLFLPALVRDTDAQLGPNCFISLKKGGSSGGVRRSNPRT